MVFKPVGFSPIIWQGAKELWTILRKSARAVNFFQPARLFYSRCYRRWYCSCWAIPALLKPLPDKKVSAYYQTYGHLEGSPAKVVDNHPNELANRVIAEEILKALGKNFVAPKNPPGQRGNWAPGFGLTGVCEFAKYWLGHKVSRQLGKEPELGRRGIWGLVFTLHIA